MTNAFAPRKLLVDEDEKMTWKEKLMDQMFIKGMGNIFMRDNKCGYEILRAQHAIESYFYPEESGRRKVEALFHLPEGYLDEYNNRRSFEDDVGEFDALEDTDAECAQNEECKKICDVMRGISLPRFYGDDAVAKLAKLREMEPYHFPFGE